MVVASLVVVSPLPSVVVMLVAVVSSLTAVTVVGA